MTPDQLPWLTLGVLIIAFLYSSVGHAGASGYIAVMTLFFLPQEIIRPTSLALNVVVACIGSYHFWKAGHFRWEFFWPFALFAFPLAFIGGSKSLPAQVFKVVVGVVLLFSAGRFLYDPREPDETSPPRKSLAFVVGGALGLLAGLTGTGGGIFLTPLIILMKWAPTKVAAATSVVFILCNSISGLLGNVLSTGKFPLYSLALAPAAVIGGAAGSYLGSHRFSPVLIKRLLAAVLIIAGLKLVWFELPIPTVKAPAGDGSTASSPR